MKDNPFRSTKIHGYKKVDQDASIDLLRTLPLFGFYLILVRVAIICVMLMIAEYQPNIKGALDFLYHFINNVAWFTTGMFLFIYHKNIIGYPYHMHLEKISYIAYIASILNIIFTIAYGVIEIMQHYWLSVYYFLEVIIWVILAIFFYSYWKHCKRSHSHGNKS